MEGFEVLVEKEWISFGHKFHDRLAPGREKYFAHNEACPVFQQWIECVWQVQRQFPCAFEFNENFLLFLVDSLLSGTFGNFSFNCEKEVSLMFCCSCCSVLLFPFFFGSPFSPNRGNRLGCTKKRTQFGISLASALTSKTLNLSLKMTNLYSQP
uniref:Myotubularin phosphatase domain-containing protein n=2 Tax=Paramoeba aestuarina TaxID=180227 RepID=A0A7S4UQW7_9EUKA